MKNKKEDDFNKSSSFVMTATYCFYLLLKKIEIKYINVAREPIAATR